MINIVGKEIDTHSRMFNKLVHKGGEIIRSECERYKKKNGILKIGSCFTSPGGRLPSMIVIHSSCPMRKEHSEREGNEMLRQTVLSCLERAESMGCESVSIPLIGTGCFGFDVMTSSQIVLDVCSRFLFFNSFLSRIHVFCSERPEFDSIHCFLHSV